MVVESRFLELKTQNEGDMVDITARVQSILNSTGLEDGVVFLFVPGSTGALTTIEYEPGLLSDFPVMLERVAPSNVEYEHERRWHDGNGRSHVRASLIGPDLFVPFLKKELVLGPWQQIVFLELDVKPRDRRIIVQVIGE